MEDKYYHTKESVEEYVRLAKDVSGKGLIEKLTKFLAINSSLLEIGSGPGTDWRILKQFYNVIGSDNSAAFLKHLNNENANGKFIEIDAITIKTDQRFDGIYSNKVMHHLSVDELIQSSKQQYNVLNPKGVICHSFWKGVGSEVFKGLFVNYHTESSLKEVFRDCFEILLIEEYKEFEDGDSLLLIAKKKQCSVM